MNQEADIKKQIHELERLIDTTDTESYAHVVRTLRVLFTSVINKLLNLSLDQEDPSVIVRHVAEAQGLHKALESIDVKSLKGSVEYLYSVLESPDSQ